MLAKISRGNQITIPKEIVKKAHLNLETYVDIGYQNGSIVLKPVTVEERISEEQFEKFQLWALQKEHRDETFMNMKEAVRSLKKKSRRS